MTEEMRRRFAALKSGGLLPSPQGVALAIARLALRDDVGPEDLTKLIKTDPAIAGRLLRYANSASTGVHRQIASLAQAVVFLGLYRVRQLALAFSLIDAYRRGRCQAFDYPRYWSQSLATGVGAQFFSGHARVPAEDSFTCGLLSGIGRLGLASAYPAEYAEVLRAAGPGGPRSRLRAEEREAFGIDHAALSGEMLADWGLPPLFADAVVFHEHPEEAPFAAGSRAESLTWMLHLAARIALRLVGRQGECGGDDVQSLYHAAARVGVEAGELQPALGQIQKDWLDWGRELGLPGQAQDVDKLLTELPAADEAALVVVPMRVALVARDRRLLAQLAGWLRALGQEALLLEDAGRIAEVVRRQAPDVLMVDGGGAIGETLRRLRDAEGMHHGFVVALLPAADEARVPELIRAGADDYLLLPPSEAAFQARLHAAQRVVALQGFVRAEREASIRHSGEWARSNRRLLHDALTDPLTQLPNRRYGIDHLTQELAFAAHAGLPLAAIMLDIDHFKRVNDGYGHAAGDAVLRQVAALVQASCRKNDVVFRYGGEEFCVVCPATTAAAAVALAERILRALRSTRLSAEGRQLAVTASAGVATVGPGSDAPDSLIAAADAALYRAKEEGRDRVVEAAPG